MYTVANLNTSLSVELSYSLSLLLSAHPESRTAIGQVVPTEVQMTEAGWKITIPLVNKLHEAKVQSKKFFLLSKIISPNLQSLLGESTT